GRSHHRQWVGSGDARARALLTSAGYRKVRSYRRLVRPLVGALHAPAPPAGFALRPLDVERDAEHLHALDAASFSANPDYRPEPLSVFREQHLGAHDVAPDLSWVAVDGD